MSDPPDDLFNEEWARVQREIEEFPEALLLMIEWSYGEGKAPFFM